MKDFDEKEFEQFYNEELEDDNFSDEDAIADGDDDQNVDTESVIAEPDTQDDEVVNTPDEVNPNPNLAEPEDGTIRQEPVNNSGDNGETIDTPEDTTTIDNDAQDPNSELLGRYQVAQEELDKALQLYSTLRDTEFTANGEKTKSSLDPQALIQGQQMKAGFSARMESFNKYKPYMPDIKALIDAGVLGNSEQVNYAIDLLKKDDNAIKKLMKDTGITVDRMVEEEFDENEVQYQPTDYRPSESELALEEAVEIATSVGVGDKLVTELNKFDNQSLQTFAEDPSVRADVIKHMQDGTYDEVMQTVNAMEANDMYGSFRNLPDINKYAQAYKQWADSLLANNMPKNQVPQSQQAVEVPSAYIDQTQVNSEREKIEAQKEAEKYRLLAEDREKELNEQRRKASSLSSGSQRVVESNSNKDTDVLKMGAVDFDKYLDDFFEGKVDL